MSNPPNTNMAPGGDANKSSQPPLFPNTSTSGSGSSRPPITQANPPSIFSAGNQATANTSFSFAYNPMPTISFDSKTPSYDSKTSSFMKNPVFTANPSSSGSNNASASQPAGSDQFTQLPNDFTFGQKPPYESNTVGMSTPASKPNPLGNSTTPAGHPPASSGVMSNVFGNTTSLGTGSGAFKGSNNSSDNSKFTSMFGSGSNQGNPFEKNQPTLTLGKFNSLGKPDSTTGQETSSNTAPSTGVNTAPKPEFPNLFGTNTAANKNDSQIKIGNTPATQTWNQQSGTATEGPKASTGSMPTSGLFGGTSNASTSTNTPLASLFSGKKTESNNLGGSNIQTGTTQNSSPFSLFTSGTNLGSAGATASTTSVGNVPAPNDTSNKSSSDPPAQSSNQTTTPSRQSAGAPLNQPQIDHPEKQDAGAQSRKPAADLAFSSSTQPSLGSSIAGPKPDPTSVLKNKSMDEIITRWATDLSKYQKEFQRQAETVAQWDRLLMENSDHISKLFSRRIQAERDTAEIERQLAGVEGQQDYLEFHLEQYEREVDELLIRGGVVVVDGSGLQGVDLERERTYKIAEKVTERVNELNKEVTDMIEGINGVSSTLGGTASPDEPLTQVVKILNSHLNQLQLIDNETANLRAKVDAARREAQRASRSPWSPGPGASENLHGLNRSLGLRKSQADFGDDPVDHFQRSFLARR